MRAIECAWTADEPIRDLAMHADWDSVASMITALRIYLFEYGTIPSWNFFFCGGRPELSVPFSWAYTWPSVFAYAFEPNHAIIAVWLAMSAVGFLAMGLLLLRWTGGRLGASVGAGVYVLNGIFVTAVHRGHIQWAFFHLVPVLMLLFERNLEADAQKRLRLLALMTIGSFCFFSAGLPHALIYFYPAFVVLVVFRFVSMLRMIGWRRTVAVVGAPVVAHVLGLWLAMYKLWPAMRWQAEFPRPGVSGESRSLAEVVWYTLEWNPVRPHSAISFVGPVAWLVAVYALYRVLLGWMSSSSAEADARRLIVWVVTPVLAAGLVLALGTAGPLLPGHWFHHLPVLDGVRRLDRYLILTVFALSVLVAYGLTWMAAAGMSGHRSLVLASVLGFATLAPVVVHGALLLRDLPAFSLAEIRASYRLPQHPQPPKLLVTVPRRWPGPDGPPPPDHAVATLQQGYWVANCRSDLALPHVFVPTLLRALRLARGTGWTRRSPRTAVPLSVPPPTRIANLTHNQITLEYDPSLRDPVDLNLAVLGTFDFNVVTRPRRKGLVRFLAGRLDDHRLVMTARYPGPREGVLASVAGLVVTMAFFWVVSRKQTASRA